MCWDRMIDAEQPVESSSQPKQSSEPQSAIDALIKQIEAAQAEASS